MDREVGGSRGYAVSWESGSAQSQWMDGRRSAPCDGTSLGQHIDRVAGRVPVFFFSTDSRVSKMNLRDW